MIVLCGPTAVGKSALALRLAERFGAAIVSADSRQVYRGMEIGTAAPTADELARVPHYMVGYLDPSDPYDVATYQRDADACLAKLAERGMPTLLVGGSYHYVQAVIERLSLPSVPPHPQIRFALEAAAAKIGASGLHARLAALDPDAAEDILPANLRRTIRALEVIEVTGRRFSEQSRERGPARPCLRLALTCERADLYRRIDNRVDEMLRNGWPEEVRALLNRGLSVDLPAMSASGYRELVAYLSGEMGLEQAAQLVKFSTHAFARRQYAWLRRDAKLHWLSRGPEMEPAAEMLVRDYLALGAVEG